MDDLSYLTNSEIAQIARHFYGNIDKRGVVKELLNQAAIRLTAIPEPVDERELIIKLQAADLETRKEQIHCYERLQQIAEEEIKILRGRIKALSQ